MGGTVHIIQNNQVGFTTDPDDARSTTMASDLAKGFDVPIIHVNADDVAACISAVRLAFAFRQEFGHDVLIDLIGYRRFGHNEADEPAYTQPEMYQVITKHPSVRELFAKQLIEREVVTEDDSTEMTDAVWSRLADAHDELKARIASAKDDVEHATGEYQLDRTPSPEVSTAVSLDQLQVLNEELLSVPDGFTVHPKLIKQLQQRRDAFEDAAKPGIFWAHAEALAFASLLTEGVPIRMTGQDSERGTFSQRHLVLHDPKTGQEHSAIQHLPGALAPMELHNSPLSETACVGFEYGYSQEGPETLVLWEAQFGDFVNGAQVIIDQFITSGLAKWGQTSRLTLLLPHAYEGSGPEHSSARLERFLQLAAEGAIRVANPTTPAQYFHLLRRQARIAKQRPLVCMTPKGLLRLPLAASRPEELAEGRFRPVLADPTADSGARHPAVLCSGKMYYDLIASAKREDEPRGRDRARRAALSVPAERAAEPDRVLPEPRTRSSGSRRSRATWARARSCRPGCCRSCPSICTSATSAVPSAPPRARATRSPTPPSSAGSSSRRSTSPSAPRSTRASFPASAELRRTTARPVADGPRRALSIAAAVPPIISTPPTTSRMIAVVRSWVVPTSQAARTAARLAGSEAGTSWSARAGADQRPRRQQQASADRQADADVGDRAQALPGRDGDRQHEADRRQQRQHEHQVADRVDRDADAADLIGAQDHDPAGVADLDVQQSTHDRRKCLDRLARPPRIEHLVDDRRQLQVDVPVAVVLDVGDELAVGLAVGHPPRALHRLGLRA